MSVVTVTRKVLKKPSEGAAKVTGKKAPTSKRQKTPYKTEAKYP